MEDDKLFDMLKAEQTGSIFDKTVSSLQRAFAGGDRIDRKYKKLAAQAAAQFEATCRDHFLHLTDLLGIQPPGSAGPDAKKTATTQRKTKGAAQTM